MDTRCAAPHRRAAVPELTAVREVCRIDLCVERGPICRVMPKVHVVPHPVARVQGPAHMLETLISQLCACPEAAVHARLPVAVQDDGPRALGQLQQLRDVDRRATVDEQDVLQLLALCTQLHGMSVTKERIV